MKYRTHIFRNYYSFQGTKSEARMEIVNIFKKSSTFLTHFFYGKMFMKKEKEVSCWIGVKPSSFIFIDPSSNRIMKDLGYQQIEKWGYSKSELCLIVEKEDLHFESTNVDVLVSIF